MRQAVVDETRRRRLVVIWAAFAPAMTYVAPADGFDAGVADPLQPLVAGLGAALAYVYYANPGDVLSFGTAG